MKGRLLRRKGMTMIEVIIGAVLLSMVLICTLLLLSTMASLWCKGASGTGANSYASLAMRKLVLDVEHGRSAYVSGSQLVVTFPYYNPSTGDYEKTVPGVTAAYYLSGATGSEAGGTFLWKSIGAGKTRLAKNVESLSFTVTGSGLIRITLTGRDVEGGAVSPNLIQQSVRLRNS